MAQSWTFAAGIISADLLARCKRYPFIAMLEHDAERRGSERSRRIDYDKLGGLNCTPACGSASCLI